MSHITRDDVQFRSVVKTGADHAILELVEGSVLLARIDSADIPSGRGWTRVRARVNLVGATGFERGPSGRRSAEAVMEPDDDAAGAVAVGGRHRGSRLVD